MKLNLVNKEIKPLGLPIWFWENEYILPFDEALYVGHFGDATYKYIGD